MTTLILGANRGIGLELTKQLASNGPVIATYRQNIGGLESLDIETHGDIDIAAAQGIEKLLGVLKGRSLHTVIVVSGILRRSSLETPSWDDVLAQFVVNAMGPLRVAQALYPQIEKGGRLALLTSRMGSIADNGSGGAYGYRMSKAALNAAGASLALDLKDREIAVSLLHPGYVRTDMTGNSGHIDAAESASLLIARIDEMSMANSGQFVHASGEVLPW